MLPENVSVVLTTFNGSKYLRRQIDSILGQTLLPDELIISDDNSTDDTILILKTYLTNNRLKIFESDKQLGVVGNFKKAASMVKPGNWIAFADQDDVWAPQKLSRLAEEMMLIDVGETPALVYSDLVLIDKNDEVIAPSFWDERKIRPEKINLARLLYGNVVTGCTMLINYAMAEEFFCMDSDKYLHDEWLALIAYSFGKIKFLKEPLVQYRQHDSNVTFSEENKAPSFMAIIRDDFNYLLGRTKFIPHQFAMAKVFLLKYRAKLSGDQIEVMENFINIEKMNYLLQRIKRRHTYSK